MTDKSTILRSFNKHLFDFLDDLIGILPDNNEIPFAKNAFDTIKRANPTALIKSWQKFVYIPYNDYIEAGKLDYFIDKDYADDLVSVNNSEEIIKMINNIKKPIKELSDANQKHALKYLQNLCKLSLLYNDLTK
jgi:hypothetical protein